MVFNVFSHGAWLILFLALGTTSALGAERAVADPVAKRVLLISTGSRLGPGFILIDQQIIQALRSITSTRIETYAENLDIVLFPAERSRRLFTDYIAEKYADRPPDLIVLLFVGTLGVAAKALTEVFPNTPIIVAGLTEEPLRPDQFGPTVSGFAQRADPDATLHVMLRLQPDLQRIVVVAGTSEVDRNLLKRVQESMRFFDKRVEFEIWDHHTMAQLRNAIAALPPRTAVLYTRLFRDAAGQPFISSEVGRWLGEWSNVPVYVLSDAAFGTGVVGGAVASIEAFGRRAGELARLVLTGTPANSLPFEVRSDTVAMFDARALARWQIDERRLPADSVVRFRPQSIWREYRTYIVGAVAVMVLQTTLILALILQRRERRVIQGALAETQSMMDLATDAGEVGLWSRNLANGELWANAAMRRLLGFTPGETLTLERFLNRVHPDDRSEVGDAIVQAQTAGTPYQGEYRVLLPDGTERWLLIKGRTTSFPASHHTRRMGIVLDITHRKQAEESLMSQRSFLRQVIDVNPNFIFAKDRTGRFTLVNQAIADVYGVSVEQVIGKTDADFNRNIDEVEFFRRVDQQVLQTREEHFIPEERITDANGKVRWLQTVKRPLIGNDGSANQIVGASTDITRRKEAELALQEQRAELAHVERISIMGELVASLMHEINQPLTAILSNAQAGLSFMNHEPVDMQELRELLQDIVLANTRAAETIRGMRALARKDASLKFEALDVKTTVLDVIRLLHGDAVMRDISIDLVLEDGLPPVLGHRIQLQQVLLNLLLNGFDAVRQLPSDKRKIQVRASRHGDGYNVISVRDSGHGLSQEVITKIFDRFYSTKREGLGLGLAICRSIVMAHGGTLWAENNPDGGATFHFTLPLETGSEDAEPAHQRSYEVA